MLGYLRKKMAMLICTALIVGVCPDITVAQAAEEEELLLVEGKIDDGAVVLTVNTQKLPESEDRDKIRYIWEKKNKNGGWDPLTILTNNPTYTLSSGEDGEYMVYAYGNDRSYFWPYKSRVFVVKDASLEVDLISGVSATNVSHSGYYDGIISGITSELSCYRGETTDSGFLSTDGIDTLYGLPEGIYRIGYKDEICSGCVLKSGLYALYSIAADEGATKAPEATGTPETTGIPAPVTDAPKATETPVPVTDAPKATETPAPATDAPKATQKPNESGTPGHTAGTDDAISMAQAGQKITIGDVTYESTGSDSVAYAGSKKAEKKVTVPDSVKMNGKNYPVTELSAGAFRGSSVQQVSLGKNVKKIGKGAFKNCKKLKKVSFSKKIQTLEAESFSGCTSLGSVSLPATVKSVGAKAFKNCKKLKKFKLGKSSKKIKGGNIMFGGLQKNKVSIGANALENCINLRSVIINIQVTKIGNSTFKNCKKLASILVKSLKLKKVGNRALSGINHCKISVPGIRLKKYRVLFKNKGQGKKVVVAKV